MPYRLHNGVYSVRCRHPHCPFNVQMKIDQNIMGMTESDVETEARKVARDMALVAHDAIRARQHSLHNPEIRRSSGSCQLIGVTPSRTLQASGDFGMREYSRGDCILREGEKADFVCEVLSGTAYPETNKAHRYHPGDCFGAAALVPRQRRMTSVISGSDGTRVAFHNLATLTRNDPKKASAMFARVMEDTLKVIRELEKKAG
jgi:CRP-like cAMP-binding protein